MRAEPLPELRAAEQVHVRRGLDHLDDVRRPTARRAGEDACDNERAVVAKARDVAKGNGTRRPGIPWDATAAKVGIGERAVRGALTRPYDRGLLVLDVPGRASADVSKRRTNFHRLPETEASPTVPLYRRTRSVGQRVHTPDHATFVRRWRTLLQYHLRVASPLSRRRDLQQLAPAPRHARHARARPVFRCSRHDTDRAGQRSFYVNRLMRDDLSPRLLDQGERANRKVKGTVYVGGLERPFARGRFPSGEREFGKRVRAQGGEGLLGSSALSF